jgi:four helix bundle protein
MSQWGNEFAERTFAFACMIVRLYARLSKQPGFPSGINRQLLEAGTSIGANVEESLASSSRRDLAARSNIALREARETKYWLRLILATELAERVVIEPVLDEARQLVGILTVSVRKLRG